MAKDRELFEHFLQNPGSQPALRIYQVNAPSATVGYSHRKRINPAGFFGKLRRRIFNPFPRNLPLCVRPTGGGLVRHGKDLIYSVIARRDSFPTFSKVRTSYLSFHETIQEALTQLGVETRLFRCDEAGAAQNATDCFTRPVATDILFKEQKIAGGAQRRKGDAFLHQGSIQIPEGLTFQSLREAFLEAFERKFGVVWQDQVEEPKV